MTPTSSNPSIRLKTAATPSPTIVWFRRDLRLDDNPALAEACGRGGAVIPVFLLPPDDEEAEAAPGAASRYWLHQSLMALDGRLRALGSRLILRQGASLGVLLRLIDETGARAVFWNRVFEPAAAGRDARVLAGLRGRGIEALSRNGSALFEPGSVMKSDGGPFRVFTPFWRACLKSGGPRPPIGAPERIIEPERWPASAALADMRLEPRIDWAGGIREAWTFGEAGAGRALDRFTEEAIAGYATDRDRPDRPGVSRLSPHLHFGEISPHRVWHRIGATKAAAGRESFLRQLVWREFAMHLLVHFPRAVDRPLRPEFSGFPWVRDSEGLAAWREGHTGYPYIDAGMRELWRTGWMHNRVRMAVASFLVKHLRVHWLEGAAWFRDTLVDADLANNTLGWQWVAGCGADAAPYFRVFNPILQGEKFDPDGAYVRRWVPELAGLPASHIHRPWEAPADMLRRAGVRLGESYPRPIIDHARGRELALEAYGKIKKRGARESHG